MYKGRGQNANECPITHQRAPARKNHVFVWRVRMCAHVCVHLGACVYIACSCGDQKSRAGRVSHSVSPPYSLRQGLTLNLELTKSITLTSPPRFPCLCLSSSEIKIMGHFTPGTLFMDTGDPNSGTHAAEQGPYQLSLLPRPTRNHFPT